MQPKKAIKREDTNTSEGIGTQDHTKKSQRSGLIQPLTHAVDLQELARILNMNYFTLYRYVQKGRIKATRFGRVYRIAPAEVERLLKEGCEGVTREDRGEEKD